MNVTERCYREIMFDIETRIAVHDVEIKRLKAEIAQLEANQKKPVEPKRKTLGEIAFQAFDPRSSWSQTVYRENYNNAARAVAEAIIERHILNDVATSRTTNQIAAAIRKEFEE